MVRSLTADITASTGGLIMRRFTAAVGALPILASLLIVLAILAVGCDDGSPTKSPPVEQEEYIFYISADHPPHKCYRYYSLSKKVDTVDLPFRAGRGMAVAADGSRLYAYDIERYVYAVLDTDSFRVITELDYGGYGHGLAVSPDNRLVALCVYDAGENSGMWILNADDYSVVYHDTLPAGDPVFSHDSKRLYRQDSHRAYRLDLTGSEFELTSRALPYPGLGVSHMIPSHDESKYFLYRVFNDRISTFHVYDLDLDSLIFRHDFMPGRGSMEMTPDGRYVFYTNPGAMNSDVPAPFHFTAFDVENNEIYKTIETTSPRPQQDGQHVGRLAITPDGRKLVALNAIGGTFVVVDVASMEQTEAYYLGQEDVNRVLLWDVACRNGL
jgi:DNA-binding beta-propeller fold protein YncE